MLWKSRSLLSITNSTKSLLKKAQKQSDEFYVFWVTLLFYLGLWHFNPGNKIVAASFVFLALFFALKLKNLRKSLILTYFASSVVLTGKRYVFQLIEPGVFPKDVFPDGLLSVFTITPAFILASVLIVIFIRDMLLRKLPDFSPKAHDIIVVVYFIWLVVSDYFGSELPQFSLLYGLLSVHSLVVYFWLRIYFQKDRGFPELLVGLFCALMTFEGLVAMQQFALSSPVSKNIESQQSIEYFGQAVDEIAFRFRVLGTFSHANSFGMWLVYWMVVVFTRIVSKPNYIYFTTFLVSFAAVILTLSRSSWLGLTLGVLASLYVVEKIKHIKLPDILFRHLKTLLILLFPLLIFFVAPRLDRSVYTFSEGGGNFRSMQIEETIRLIAYKPVFGVGSGMSVISQMELNPRGVFSYAALSVHNWYMLTMVEHGIFSLWIFLLFLILFIRRNFNRVVNTDKKSTSMLGLGFFGGVLAVITVGFFQPFAGVAQVFLASAILDILKK